MNALLHFVFYLLAFYLLYGLHRLICCFEARREGEREYQNGLLHGRAAMYSELAAWVNEHHRDILHELPPQR